MAENIPDWKCAGCGKPSPNRVRVCECPTNVVTQATGKSEWKRPPQADYIYEQCHKLIGRLFESPNIAGLGSRDIDLIKSALKHYAEGYAP